MPASRRNRHSDPHPVKLNDVADAAGVSIATASRALNGSRPVEASIAERVRAAAEQLHYVGNYHHRSIRLGRAEALGFAHQVPQTWHNALPGGYFSSVIAGTDAAAREAGYVLTVFSPDRSQSALERGLQALDTKRIDGLVIAGEIEAVYHSSALERSADLPVAFTHPLMRIDVPSVRRDEPAAVQIAIDHLMELGHRRVLWLGWCHDQGGDWPSRQQLFVEAAWRAGIRGDARVVQAQSPWDETPTEEIIALAQQVVRQCLEDQQDPFTAVVAYNDVLAIGATRAVRSLGLSVPEDVSVVGFDNNVSVLASPPLTTIDLGFFEVGRRSGQLAIDRSRGHVFEGEEKTVFVKPRLIVRDSTAPPPGSH